MCGSPLTLHAEGGREQLEEVAAAPRRQLALVEGHQTRCQLRGQQALWRAAAHPRSRLRRAKSFFVGRAQSYALFFKN